MFKYSSDFLDKLAVDKRYRLTFCTYTWSKVLASPLMSMLVRLFPDSDGRFCVGAPLCYLNLSYFCFSHKEHFTWRQSLRKKMATMMSKMTTMPSTMNLSISRLFSSISYFASSLKSFSYSYEPASII